MCLEKVDTYAYASAANALNPIPGVDISVDIGIAFKLMDEIRQAFGLEEVEKLKKYEVAAPFAKKLIDEVVKYTTKEGIILVLKQYASKFLKAKVVEFVSESTFLTCILPPKTFNFTDATTGSENLKNPIFCDFPSFPIKIAVPL